MVSRHCCTAAGSAGSDTGGYSRGYGGKGYKRDSYREDRKESFEKNEDAVQADQERSENE